MTDFSHRRIVVTGATRGIGLAIASQLADQGAQVLITGTQANYSTELPLRYYAVDFKDLTALNRFSEFLGEFQPSILINNAGINVVSPFEAIQPEDFSAIHQVNTLAPFYLCQAVLPFMKQQGWGRIVNIASIWSTISKTGRGAYSASKFALDGMTVALAAEVAAYGILANCVSPGFIDTDLTRRVLSIDEIKALCQQIPQQRLGQPAEIAKFVAWLVSDENTYISGQNLFIDGGFSRV